MREFGYARNYRSHWVAECNLWCNTGLAIPNGYLAPFPTNKAPKFDVFPTDFEVWNEKGTYNG